MSPKQARPWPAPPRAAERLDAPTEPLGDGSTWAGVEAGPNDSFAGAASQYDIAGSRLHGVRLTGAALDGGQWADVVVEDCELSATTLDGTVLARVVFRRCRMSGLVAIGARARDVEFDDCKIDAANFRESSFERCAFLGCDLRGSDFYGATLAPARLHRCDLVATDFSKAQCTQLDIRGSMLADVKGASSLRGCVITPEQMVPLGLALLAAFDVQVADAVDGP